jgi:ElaB/YqjD/DUF883 family membrane-anchored ribosome-binding protein
MNRLSSRSIAATLLAAGLLLSACGQSDASGRIRNSSPEGECYETQEKKESEVAFYQSQADEARRLGERLDELKKKQDDLGAVYTAMLPKDGETWASLYAKIDNTSDAAQDEWAQMMEEVYQASLAAAAAADEYAAANNEYRALPQYNHFLAQASEKAVCVTTIPVESVPETSIPETQITTPVEQDNDACLNAPNISTGTNYTLRQGEELVLEVPLCPQWGESAGVLLGADGSVNSRIESNVTSANGVNTAFIRITGSVSFTTSFWMSQSKRSWPYADSEKSYFSVTVVPVETIDPCVDKTPDVSMNNDGILTGRSDCDAATHWEMVVTDAETNEIKAHWALKNNQEPYISEDLREYFGTRKYIIESSHFVQSSNGANKRRVGLTNRYEFQFKAPSNNQIDQRFDPLGIVDLPPVLFVEPVSESDSDSQSSDDAEPIVSPAIAVVEPRTTSIKCDEACTDNVVKQSGIEPAKVKEVEVSVNGSAWETLTPELVLPLALEATTIQLRVTPTGTERPVVLSTTVYKNAAAVNASTDSQTLIVSGSGTQSVEVEVTADDSGSTTFIVLIIALLVGLLILIITVLPRIRRKPGA